MDLRIPPLPPDQLGPLARLVAAGAGWATRATRAARATRGDPPAVFTTLGRHRRLFRTWLLFAGTLLFRTRLPRGDVELLVLRTARNCRSAYEWAQHAGLGRRAGLDPEIVAVAAAAVDTGRDELSERQGLLLEAADELHERRVLTAATWASLAEVLDDRQLVELCMIVGHYEMLAMTLNSLGTPPDRAAVAALDAADRAVVDRLAAGCDELAAG